MIKIIVLIAALIVVSLSGMRVGYQHGFHAGVASVKSCDEQEDALANELAQACDDRVAQCQKDLEACAQK